MKTTFERKIQFLEAGPEVSNPEKASVVVLPIPLEQTTSYKKGTCKGPEAIIEASTQVEFFDSELQKEPCGQGIYTDWSLGSPEINQQPTPLILQQIREKTAFWLKKDRFILALGGEHTITVGLLDPFIEKWKNQLTLVQIDAHADLREEYLGNPLSHACSMKRLLGKVPMVSVGIRSLDQSEFQLIQERKLPVFFAHSLRKNPDWISEVLSQIKTPYVYLSLDVDGFDPSVVPSVGTPEPGGLLWDETLEFLKKLSQNFTLVGADVNELCPGPLHYADFTVAKLCYKIIGYRTSK